MSVYLMPHLVRSVCRRAGKLLFAAMLAIGLGQSNLAQAASPASTVPLQPGLVLGFNELIQGAAVHDYVAYMQVSQFSAEQLVLDGYRRIPDAAAPGGYRFAKFSRVVRGEDLRAAWRISPQYITDDPAMFPGYTANEASATLLADLKRGAATPFVFAMTPMNKDASANGLDMVSGALKDVPQVGVMMTGLSSEFTRKYYRGSLQRVEPGTVPIPVLRDGAPTMLPAIHARGALKAGSDSGVADFWFLDDPANALLLRWSFQGRTAEIVHIDAPDRKEAASARMTTALSSPASARSTVAGAGCHVALHGIYFDSGSADLLPISDATLSDVASLIKAHPDWNLTIEGHTDNIGSATSNQDLSQRRAQAVRQALIRNHGVPPVHLLAQGFGATRPVDSNSTVVGRARNRRVELARACH